MIGRIRLVAASLLALWIFLVAAPAVFGAPECGCADCRDGFCLMKKAQAGMTHASCHEHSAQQNGAFQSGPCQHEVTPVVFLYHAVLTDTDRSIQNVFHFLNAEQPVAAPFFETQEISPPPKPVLA